MLKSLLTTETDLKEAAIIEKRRRAEEERKRRFFDAKSRILGIDSYELDRQVEEKERIRQTKLEQQRIADEEMKKNIEIAEARQQELNDQKRQSEIEMNNFRRQQQQLHDGNDFDLIDPDGLKKTLPARVDDEDPRLSKSGGQLFIGEDLMHQQRIREQQILQRQWLDQQIAEKKNIQMNQKRADMQMAKSMSHQDLFTVEKSERMLNDKREIQRQIREYNQALATQKRDNDKKRRDLEQKDNLAEIFNNLSSDLLKEQQPKGSNLGPNRIVPYAYKHMSEEQIDKVRQDEEFVKRDLEEQQMKAEEDREHWAQVADDNHRMMTLKERELSRNIRFMNVKVREENENLAQEQRKQIDHFETVINTNPPTDEYFEQFNTTSRWGVKNWSEHLTLAHISNISTNFSKDNKLIRYQRM